MLNADRNLSKSGASVFVPSGFGKTAAPSPPNDQLYLRWNNYQTNLTGAFKQLLLNQMFVDVTLACDGQSIKVHKAILSACSPFLHAIFNDHPHQHPIIMLDVKWPELKAIVDFMYTGEITVNQFQMIEILRIAEMLKVRGLVGNNGENGGSSDVEMNSNALQRRRDSLITEPEMTSKSTQLSNDSAKLDPMLIQENEQNEKISSGYNESVIGDIMKYNIGMKPDQKSLTLEASEVKPSSSNDLVAVEKNSKTTTTETTITDLRVECYTAGHTEDHQQQCIDYEYTVNKIRGILNELRPSNFDDLMLIASNLSLNNAETLRMVAFLIVEKSVSETTLTSTYCKFCKYLISLKGFDHILFKSYLVMYTQKEFKGTINNAKAKAAKLNPLIKRLEAATDVKEKEQVKTELDDQEYQFRCQAWETVDFIGTLYEMGLIKANIVCTCVEELMEAECEDLLDYMYNLLIVAGPQLEIANLKPIYDETWNIKERLDKMFATIRQVIKKKEPGTAIHTMMEDIVELRAQNWSRLHNSLERYINYNEEIPMFF